MLYIIKTSRIQDVLSKKLRIVKNILGRGGRGAWRSPPAEIGELPKHRKQRVSTVHPLAGWPTGRGVLIYCLNRSSRIGADLKVMDVLPQWPWQSIDVTGVWDELVHLRRQRQRHQIIEDAGTDRSHHPAALVRSGGSLCHPVCRPQPQCNRSTRCRRPRSGVAAWGEGSCSPR